MFVLLKSMKIVIAALILIGAGCKNFTLQDIVSGLSTTRSQHDQKEWKKNYNIETNKRNQREKECYELVRDSLAGEETGKIYYCGEERK